MYESPSLASLIYVPLPAILSTVCLPKPACSGGGGVVGVGDCMCFTCFSFHSSILLSSFPSFRHLPFPSSYPLLTFFPPPSSLSSYSLSLPVPVRQVPRPASRFSVMLNPLTLVLWSMSHPLQSLPCAHSPSLMSRVYPTCPCLASLPSTLHCCQIQPSHLPPV